MFNVKNLLILATTLTVIGVLGSFATHNMVEKTTTLTEDIANSDFNNIEIDVTEGNVEIIPTNKETPSFEMTGYRLQDNFSYTVTDEELSIVYHEMSKKIYNFGPKQKSVSLKLYIPEKEYHLIHVKAKNGEIQLANITATDLQLHAGNGFVDLENSYADDVEIHAKNGEITVDQMTGKTVTLQADNGKIQVKDVIVDNANFSSKNGKITLTEVTGSLFAKANNGGIIFTTEKLNSAIDFSAKNGKIQINTKQEPGDVVIKAQAHNGKTTIFNENTTSTQFGSGEYLINLQANNGKITVSN